MAAKENKTETNHPNEVTIKLPLTEEKQDDLFVGVNGVSYLIKRGEEVTVPYGVYEVIKNSEKMDTLALQRSMKLRKG